ncbi:MAG: helix-hairpin-helix domain-containing protein [Chitinophagaceae bacterium]|nr:helix-hairpin-helix domain-containing protein [Chitinophagaceae bacterium]
MKKWWKDYLTFNKIERVGLFILLGLIGLIWVLPKYFKKSPSKESIVLQQESGLDSIKNDQLVNNQNFKDNLPQKHQLFFFDPNTCSEADWGKLGLKPKTIATIGHYIEKGGRFQNPDDIKKIYGIKPDLAELLIPYVRINAKKVSKRYDYQRFPQFKSHQNTYDSGFHKIKKTTTIRKFVSIDINKADTLQLIDLPGIGPTLAQRIIKFRENLGGFISVEQLLEVYGIKDSVFQILKPQLICSKEIKTISINLADFNAINRHPYIGYQEAKAIVKYRDQHGIFKMPSDLLKLAIVDEIWLQKITPYLNFD